MAGGEELQYLLRALTRRLNRLDKEEAACCGLSLSQCYALLEIEENPQRSLGELSLQLGLDKSTASRTLDGLEKRGLVNRRLNSEDRRFLCVGLTEQGLSNVRCIRQGFQEYYERVYGAIPEGKREMVLEALRLLIKAMDGTKCCE